jgi:predicted RecA/RadA family phage recombinase
MAAVLATSGESWVAGQVLYVAASGLATKTAGSNKILGHYLGSAATTDATTLYDVNTKQTN